MRSPRFAPRRPTLREAQDALHLNLARLKDWRRAHGEDFDRDGHVKMAIGSLARAAAILGSGGGTAALPFAPAGEHITQLDLQLRERAALPPTGNATERRRAPEPPLAVIGQGPYSRRIRPAHLGGSVDVHA